MIRLAVIVDNMGTFGETPDEERDKIIEEVKEATGKEVKLVFYGHLFSDLPAEKQVDLVVVDYGALWQMNMNHESRLVVKWAEEHPGSLVMIWSTLTTEVIISDVLSPFDDSIGWYKAPEFPDNLRPYYPPSGLRIPYDKREEIEANWIYGDDFMREWFK